jgi:2'-5' RNA ligase
MTNESWRLFIAIELPHEILKAIVQIQTGLKKEIPDRAVRWTRPEGIHLTLKFLGDVRPGQLDALKAGLSQAVSGHSRIELGIRGLGCFPNLARPRVLWLGVLGDIEALRALQADVEQTIAPLGFPTEERGFSPHLTLARTPQEARRDELAQIGEIVQKRDVEQLISWQVKAISLMRSHLKPDGAQYTCVSDAALGTPPAREP